MLKQIVKSIFGIRPKTDLKKLIAEGAWVIDVRTPEEFRQGHASNSTNIPLNILPQKMAEIKKKGRAVITICRTGNRSGMAKNMLLQQGITAFNGGAWQSFEKQTK